MWQNYEKMISGETNGSGANGGAANGGGLGRGETFCSGVVHVGRASMPYSLRLLPGTLALDPPELQSVSSVRHPALLDPSRVDPFTFRFAFQFRDVQQGAGAEAADADGSQRVPGGDPHHAHRDPARSALILPRTYLRRSERARASRVRSSGEVFARQMEALTPLGVAAGAARAVLRVRLRAPPPAPPSPPSAAAPPGLRTWLTLHTNLSDYTVPLLLYEGTLTIVSSARG